MDCGKFCPPKVWSQGPLSPSKNRPIKCMMSEVRFWDLLVEEVLKQEKKDQGLRSQQAMSDDFAHFSKPHEDRLMTWLTAHTSARPIAQDPKVARNTYQSTQRKFKRSERVEKPIRAEQTSQATDRQSGQSAEPEATGPVQESAPRPMGSLEMVCLMRLKKWGASSLSENMSALELKSAYRALAKRFHPDRNPESEVPFHEIRECYEILSAWLNKPS